MAKISLSAELTTDRGWKCQLIGWQLLVLCCAPPPECRSPSPQLCLHTSVHHQAVVRFLSDSSNKTEIERGHDTVFCWQLLLCEIARLKVKCLHTQENTGTHNWQPQKTLSLSENYYVHFSSHMWDDIHKSSCLDEPALLIGPQLLFQIKHQATNYLQFTASITVIVSSALHAFITYHTVRCKNASQENLLRGDGIIILHFLNFLPLSCPA